MTRALHAVLCLVLLLLVACGPAKPPADLEAVAHPDLATVEDAIRRQLGEQRAELDDLLREGAEARALADAFGGMGELYHAYRLYPAAAACYRNAARLDPGSFLWPYYLGLVEKENGDLAAAAASLERALELRPESAQGHLRLGDVRLAQGDAAAAAKAYAQALPESSFAAAAHFGLGNAAAAAGDPRQAVEHFEKVLELAPEAGSVHHPLGLAYRQLGDEAAAATHLAEKGGGEATYPDPLVERLESLAVSSGAYLQRGNRALVNGRFDAAVEAFRQAVEAEPANVEARRNLALALVRKGDAGEAVRVLEEALAVDPENVWLHFDLGTAQLARGNPEPAIAAFQAALARSPDFTEAHFNLGNTLGSLGRWAEARPHLERVLELEPGNRQARYLRAMARQNLGESAAAIAELETLVAAEPGDLATRDALVQVLLAAGQKERAAAVYDEALSLDIPAADKTRILSLLAEQAWREGRRQEAVARYRHAVELSPDSSQTISNLANVLQLLGDREEAITLFARATEVDPTNAAAWLSEGSLHILGGDFRRASERLEQALVHHPKHVGINHTLARLLATCADNDVRDGRRALLLAQTAFNLEQSLEHGETVAMAMAEIGDFEKAVQWQRGLITQAARSGSPQNVLKQLAQRLALYEERRPVRIAPTK